MLLKAFAHITGELIISNTLTMLSAKIARIFFVSTFILSRHFLSNDKYKKPQRLG
jgi:hypothetical protein